jgi:hypothetical protein
MSGCRCRVSEPRVQARFLSVARSTVESMFESLSGAGVIAAALIAPPSGELITALAGIDPATVSESAQVDLMVAWERQAAFVAACAQPPIAAVAATAEADCTSCEERAAPEGVGRAEIGAALRISPIAAYCRQLVAEGLCGRLAMVGTALAAGDICYRQAQAIVEATAELSDEQAQAVARKVLGRAGRQTIGELRRALRRAVLASNPTSAKKRAAKALAERGLDWWTREDGMAEMRVVTSAADIMAMVAAVDTLARHDFGSTRDGSRILIAARRADALAQLVTATGAGTGGRPAATVAVTMDLPTALALADHPAELAGYGPIDAATARTLAADGCWRRMICEPLTGALLDLGHTSYQPSAALARYLKLRDVRCEFPGCGQPASRSHLDHTRPYRPNHPDGGGTDRNNMGALCDHHHQLKHRTGWRLRRDPDTEEATWTSPTGHTYRVQHHDHRSWEDELYSYPTSDDTGDIDDTEPHETNAINAITQEGEIGEMGGGHEMGDGQKSPFAAQPA